MADDYKVLELFPTPVFTAFLPTRFAALVERLYGEELQAEGPDEANFGKRSVSSHVLDAPDLAELASHLLSQVDRFATEALRYRHGPFRLTQSWISTKAPGQHHTVHTHANSVISGILFFGTAQSNTPAVCFHKAMGTVNAPYIHLDSDIGEGGSRFSRERHYVDFVPGMLVLFPSHLHHSVPLNESRSTRYSLAFNAVPAGGLGRADNLTELLF